MEQEATDECFQPPCSDFRDMDELAALFKDLHAIGMIAGAGMDLVRGSVSAKVPGNGLVLVEASQEGQEVKPFASFASLESAADKDAMPCNAGLEVMLHRAVYEGAADARCAAVLTHGLLHEQLILGKAPSAAGDGPYEMYGSLRKTALKRSEDGIIVLPSLPGVFVMYAPTMSHLRDLLYMLGQGYIPM